MASSKYSSPSVMKAKKLTTDKYANAPLRVVIQQPGLPLYRIPFFKECASRSGIKLTLFYGAVNGLPNITPDGFAAHYEQMRTINIGLQQLLWHSAQWRHLNHYEADVVVLSWNVRYLTLVPSLIRARLLKIPVVLWGHGVSKRDTPLRFSLRNVVARLGTALVFYSESVAQHFSNQGWPHEKIFVANNSLDQSNIEAAKKKWFDQAGALEEFQERNELAGRPVLINIGRIYEQNGCEVLIQALPGIAERWRKIKLVIIGRVNEEAERLKHLAKRLNVSENIVWTGEIYEEEQIAPWMLSSQLFCYPTNVGLSIMHAMGYGVPVVIGDAIQRHAPEVEVFKDGINGRMFCDGNPSSLAATINSLLADPATLSKMSTAAYETIRHKYTIPKMADGFVAAVRYAAQSGIAH